MVTEFKRSIRSDRLCLAHVPGNVHLTENKSRSTDTPMLHLTTQKNQHSYTPNRFILSDKYMEEKKSTPLQHKKIDSRHREHGRKYKSMPASDA